SFAEFAIRHLKKVWSGPRKETVRRFSCSSTVLASTWPLASHGSVQLHYIPDHQAHRSVPASDTGWFLARRSIQLSYGRAVDKYQHNAASCRHATQSGASHAFAGSRLPNSARCSSGPKKITNAPVKSTTAAKSPMARP